MKICYISDDGKYFENLEDCKKYESKNDYVVEFVGIDYHFVQSFKNKQDCQHFVADYIHKKLKTFKAQSVINFFNDTKITVSHKSDITQFNLIDLIEEVPAHYKIKSGKFHHLIR